jgi:hypothetical protein
MRARVDLGDAPHRPVEECAVVRDKDDRTREAVDERLELCQPVGVQVVRRLVEQEQVGLRKEQRRERGPRRLAARQAVERPVEVDAEPEPRAGRRRACVEITAAECEEPGERPVVSVGQRLW